MTQRERFDAATVLYVDPAKARRARRRELNLRKRSYR